MKCAAVGISPAYPAKCPIPDDRLRAGRSIAAVPPSRCRQTVRARRTNTLSPGAALPATGPVREAATQARTHPVVVAVAVAAAWAVVPRPAFQAEEARDIGGAYGLIIH